MFTKITYSRIFEKQIEKIPVNLQVKVRFWASEVQRLGINALIGNRAFRDEALKGKRRGQRSIRLNRAYRLIYEIKQKNVHIHILEVNKHEY